jgi:hypothetical protein
MATLGVIAVEASPANAAGLISKCNTSSASNVWVVDLPLKADAKFIMTPCVYRSGNQVWAKVHWYVGCILNEALSCFGSSHRFDSVKVIAVLEKRTNGTTHDYEVTHVSCDITSEANFTVLYDPLYRDGDCYTPISSSYTSTYDWSADGAVLYDVDNDGYGAFQHDLVGSPLIY